MVRSAILTLAGTLFATQVVAQDAVPTPARSAQLVRMVRQDCGSCHGMRLTGGLGPSLAREALAGKNTEYLAAVITHGIPGTPMPPWSAMLSPSEAQWVAEQLLRGFPEEHRNSAP
ncbi:MAG: cytochrome c [Comamonadaceae bacterium]|nr:cytochrome c [Comamonadaceae bacterium]